jgi:hypothetical protein
LVKLYNSVDIEHSLLTHDPEPPFPTVQNREAWKAIAARLGDDAAAEVIQIAEATAEERLPEIPATLYLEVKRTGQREGYQNAANRHRLALWELTLAELLEDEGRFLDPILDVAWGICEESSWAWPAHQVELADMDRAIIDLNAVSTALMLAELESLLNERLYPMLRKRIRDEIDRRIFTPYLQYHDHWWLYNTRVRSVNNWTAVCNAGVVGSATYLEGDAARLADMIAKAGRSMSDYLDTFDADGGSTEGPGYWNYGFGNYIVFAHLVHHRTGGEIDFFDDPRIRKIAQFPAKTLLSPGLCTNFSDCSQKVTFSAPLLVFLSEKFNLPNLTRIAQMQEAGKDYLRGFEWSIRALAWPVPSEPAGAFTPNAHDWYGEMMWMIARYDPNDWDSLSLAAKGGHNGEMHNQNDTGNIIVHVNQESVIRDLGAGRYTKQYFGPTRYDPDIHLMNSSLGHSLPVPNGQAQLAGREYAAELLEHRADDEIDLLKIELKGAYPPEADLESLVRTAALHRETPHGWVELADEFAFASGPGAFESVLITYADVEEGDDALTLTGERGALRVAFDPDVVDVRVEIVEDVDVRPAPRDVTRVIFAIKGKMKEGAIRLKIEPIK